MNKNFDFIYIGHGIGYPEEKLQCYIWFKDIIKEEDQEKIVESIPETLSYFFDWHENILFFGSDEQYLRLDVREKYNEEINSILSSDNQELIDKYYDEGEEKYGNPDEPTNEEWEKFYIDLDNWLIKVNSEFPIKFFTKDDFTNKQTEWHKWSLEQILTEVFPCFEEYINSDKINDEKYVEMNTEVAWFLNILLNHYINSNPVSSLSEDIKFRIMFLIESLPEIDEYIDDKNYVIIRNILKSFPEGKDLEILKNKSPESLLKFFSASAKNYTYLSKLSNKNEFEYLKKLLSKTDINKTADYILSLSLKIANIELEPTLSTYNIIKNHSSKPLLGAQILELAFDFPDCPDKLFEFAGTIYTSMEKWDKGIEVYEKAIKKDDNNPMYLTGLLYSAINAKHQDIVDKYINFALSKPEILKNPYPLANIIYALNTKKTEKDSKLSIELVESYWKNPERKTLTSLYTNMCGTYIVANKLSPVFDEIIGEVTSNLQFNYNYYGPVMLENIACYYAMKDDKEKALKYLGLAKEYEHDAFDTLKDIPIFAKYKSDKDFNALFT